MSFVSRYSEEIPTAIDWEPLSLSAELTVMEAIALWGDYFRQRSSELCQGIAPVSWAVVSRESTLVGLLPDWQLAGALWGETGLETRTLADICLPVSQPLTLDELPSFSALISAFSQTSTTVLPIWNEKQQGWGLLSIGNIVRRLDLEQVWQRLPLHAVATPVSLLETPVTVGELGQRCCEHQLGAMPLILPADSQAGRVQCLSLNDYLIQFPLHPQQRIEVDGMSPSPICRIGCSYSQARQVLQQQRGDYVVVTQCTGELHGWVTPHLWIEQLQPEALLTTLERDINENQRTKAALQTREDQLQTLINTIADGILIVDQGGTVIYANPVACQMFGSTPCQLLQSHLGVAIAPQNPTEITIVLPDQTSGIGELKSTTILWQGQPCSLIAIRDVTERQRVLAQWQASEEEYRNLLETLPNLVWRLTATGELEDCNQRTLDYLGQPKNQVLGTAWQRFIHPDELSLILEQWQDGLANGIFFELEYRLRRGDGAYHWQLLQMLPLPDSSGEIGYWLASNTDINSLKQAENQVRQQAQQEQILANLGQRIRQSLNLEQILNNAVEEVRRTLQVDRVLVYQVYENGTGAAIAESVAEGYSSVLAMTFAEEVFPPECYERYVNGYVYALTDRETGFVLDCLVDFLASIQVRAKLVVPLVFEEKLWGLLIAHQCSGPRIWKKYEVQLLQSLGNQLAIAIQQSLLYQRLREELVERTKAEQQLLDLTRLQQAILDGANYMIISIDSNGRILTFNRKAEELLGYRADEVINQCTPLLFHDPDEVQCHASNLSEELQQTIDPTGVEVFTVSALQQDISDSEWTYIAKNGDRFPVHLSVAAMWDVDNQPIGFVGIASDLRQQKQLEAERETLDFVVRNSTELIVIADLDQTIIFLNQAGQNLLGIDDEIAIKQTNLKEYLTPDSLTVWQTEIMPQVFHARAWEGEFSLKHRQTGQEIPVTASTFLLSDPETHQPQNLVGIMHDITHIKNAEKRILTALESERELSELRSRFITMASHEFRTPLSIISSSTSILESYYQRLSDEKRQEHLERVQNSVKHITSLLDDVLTMNRAEAKRLHFQPQCQDLILFCQTIRDDLQVSNGDYQILFLPENLPSSLTVDFDPKLLQQILTNLLGNAIKYSPDPGTIEFHLRRDNDAAVFTIQDQGIGIPPEDLARIFENFHRSHNVGNIQGTGLGLTIAKKCTELHGGTIQVTSKLGQGSCFTVRLPL